MILFQVLYLFMWLSHWTATDCQCHMKEQNYKKWMWENLFPTLRPVSIVVLESVSWHNVVTIKVCVPWHTKTRNEA